MDEITNAQYNIAAMPTLHTQPNQPGIDSQYIACQESPKEIDMETPTSPGMGQGS